MGEIYCLLVQNASRVRVKFVSIDHTVTTSGPIGHVNGEISEVRPDRRPACLGDARDGGELSQLCVRQKTVVAVHAPVDRLAAPGRRLGTVVPEPLDRRGGPLGRGQSLETRFDDGRPLFAGRLEDGRQQRVVVVRVGHVERGDGQHAARHRVRARVVLKVGPPVVQLHLQVGQLVVQLMFGRPPEPDKRQRVRGPVVGARAAHVQHQLGAAGRHGGHGVRRVRRGERVATHHRPRVTRLHVHRRLSLARRADARPVRRVIAVRPTGVRLAADQ